jgi:hypothetical protein
MAEAKAYLGKQVSPRKNYLLGGDGSQLSVLVETDREVLVKRFDMKLRQLLNCLSSLDVKAIPPSLLKYLKSFISEPHSRDLTPMEINRINLSSHTNEPE